MSSRGRSCYDWQWISTDNILTRQEILEFLITVGRVGGRGGGLLGNVQQRAKLLRLAVDQHRQYTNEARNPGVSYYSRQGWG